MKIKPITVLGLFTSLFGYLIILAVLNLPPISGRLSENGHAIAGLILIWVLVSLLLIIIKNGEKRGLTSIGFKSITGKEILTAIVFGLSLSLLVPFFTNIASKIIPSTGRGIGEVVSNTPWWLILMSILTAGVSEEIVFRGYILERVLDISENKWFGIVPSVIAFVLPHTLSWNMAHVFGVVLPLGLILTGLYIWKRNLVFNIIVHIVVDLPLVVLALIQD